MELITSLKKLSGKTIKKSAWVTFYTSNGTTGVALVFTDDTYAIFKPTEMCETLDINLEKTAEDYVQKQFA